MDENVKFTSESLIFGTPPESEPTELLISKQSREKSQVKLTLESLTSALKECKIIDTIPNSLSGTIVLLPRGIRLFQQFNKVVKNSFKNFGLEEYHYPILVSTDFFSPVYDYLSLKNKLLHVGNDKDFEDGVPRGTLCPTGEEVIYPHWKACIKTERDLPIELYRQANYYRPSRGKHRGGLFRSMEAFDVFEFHCGYAQVNRHKFSVFQNMLFSLVDYCCLPTLWSDRPLVTNNEKVSKRTIGCDALLPLGKTVQISSIYDQQDLLSKLFEIQYKKEGKSYNTHHITGFISRRVVWSCLFLGLKKNGSFFLNPNLSPTQAYIIMQSSPTSQENLNEISQILDKYDIRYTIKVIGKKDRLNRVIQDSFKALSCLCVVVRQLGDEYKLSIINSLDETEKTVMINKLYEISRIINQELNQLDKNHRLIVRDYVKYRIKYASDISQLRASSDLVQAFPLVNNPNNISKIESQVNGEILGFIPLGEKKKCILTNKDCSSIALLSVRL